jgi:rRNA maturation protein Nop10
LRALAKQSSSASSFLDCFVAFAPRNDERNKKEAERRKAQRSNHRTLTVRRCPDGGSTPLGVPPRFSPKGLCSSRRLSVRPCFLGRGRSVRSCTAAPTGGRRPKRCSTGVTRAVPVPVQRSTSRAGHCAGGMMPEPPGSEGDEPKPAGTALTPPTGVTGQRPLRERDSLWGVTEIVTNVNGNVTRRSALRRWLFPCHRPRRRMIQ